MKRQLEVYQNIERSIQKNNMEPIYYCNKALQFNRERR